MQKFRLGTGKHKGRAFSLNQIPPSTDNWARQLLRPEFQIHGQGPCINMNKSKPMWDKQIGSFESWLQWATCIKANFKTKQPMTTNPQTLLVLFFSLASWPPEGHKSLKCKAVVWHSRERKAWSFCKAHTTWRRSPPPQACLLRCSRLPGKLPKRKREACVKKASIKPDKMWHKAQFRGSESKTYLSLKKQNK